MRASGVSLYRLLLPFIGVGLISSLVVGYVNEKVGPMAAQLSERILHQERHKDRLDVNLVYNATFKNELEPIRSSGSGKTPRSHCGSCALAWEGPPPRDPD